MSRVRVSSRWRKGGRPLRPREWGGLLVDNILSAGNQAGIWIINPVDVAELHEPTVVRLLISVAAASTVGVNGRLELGVGVIRVSGDPSSTAVPSIAPSAAADLNADWLYQQTLIGTSPVAATLYVNNTTDAPKDIGSQRKLTNHEGLMLSVSNEFGTASCSYIVALRYLVKQ